MISSYSIPLHVAILTVEVPDNDTYFKIRYNTLSTDKFYKYEKCDIKSKGSHGIRVKQVTFHVFV